MRSFRSSGLPWQTAGQRRRNRGSGGDSNAAGGGYYNDHDDSSCSDSDSEVPPFPMPDAATMAKRAAFREMIRRETADHRRTIPQPPRASSERRRNIMEVLYDRERRGNTMTLMRLPGGGSSKALMYRKKRGGDQSPSTVFESPISTTTRLLYHQQDAPNHSSAMGALTDEEPVGDYDEDPVLMASTSDETTPTIRPSAADPAGAASNSPLGNANDETSPTRMHADDGSKSKSPCRNTFYPMTIRREVQTYAEHCSALKYQSAFLHHLGGDDALDEHGNRPTSSWAVSTISIAFSPDAQTMASTHGDHTVKISSCNTGRLLRSLDGHPRTPWTVKYHPTDSAILASGCLGHQVRIWNWHTKTCLQMVRLEFAIISLSFHPSGKVLAVANGTRLHFWGIADTKSTSVGNSRNRPSTNSGNRHNQHQPSDGRTILTEMDQRHMLRCVHFPPNGRSIIIGGVNPSTEDARRRQRGGGIGGGGGMSFYLRLWDFDLDRALNPQSDMAANGITIARRPISNPRTFVPRALLYNDGGFDISPDGKTLCACAEYWLPEGVDSAMELLQREEVPYGADGSNEPPEEENHPNSDDRATVSAENRAAVAAALNRLRGITRDNIIRGARSPSFRDGMDQHMNRTPCIPRTPPVTSRDSAPTLEFVPQTPPNPNPGNQPPRLSPPSPPGRRFAGGLGQAAVAAAESAAAGATATTATNSEAARGFSTPPPPPPPPAPPAPVGGVNMRPPHPLSVVSKTGTCPDAKGRYVPHVVTVSLNTDPLPEDLDPKVPRGKAYGAVSSGYRPRLGQLLEACPLDPSKASAVTCVKFSPSTDFCLIGYGVREPLMTEGGGNFHPVTAIYRLRGGMSHVSTMLSGDDDVNIARFHPDSGHGFVYGTKQGRVRILSPRPWNYYNC